MLAGPVVQVEVWIDKSTAVDAFQTLATEGNNCGELLSLKKNWPPFPIEVETVLMLFYLEYININML